jgi:hypothetical protein
MSHKNFNIFSNEQSLFGSGNTYAGWEVTSSNGQLFRINEKGFYPTYVPGDRPGYSFIKNTLLVYSAGTDDVVVKSPWISAKSAYSYMASMYVAVEDTSATVTLDLEVSTTSSGTGDTYSSNSSLRQPTTADLADGDSAMMFQSFNTLSNTSFVRMIITFAGQGSDPLTSQSGLFLYDPVISEDNITDSATFVNVMYNLLPSFMLLDDQSITDYSETHPGVLPLPLLRFVEVLTRPASEIADITIDFDYTRPTAGTESKSKLTDPDTAAAGSLLWLANVTGSTLLTAASGFTPWAAFDGYDWDDFDLIDGVDDDSVEWIDLQDFSVDFFDTVQGYRDQIRTGFSGLNAGRRDAIVNYLRTQLQTDSPTTAVLTVMTSDKDSPYRVELLVDPNVDPDASGTQLSDAVNNSMIVGGIATKVSQVTESAQGGYDFTTAVYPATESDEGSGGVTYYGKSFISDVEGYGRNILLNENSASATVPELGGGVGHAHFTTGSQYFYGDLTSSTYGSLLTASSSSCDLGASTTGFDIIAVVSDLKAPTAAVDTAGAGGVTPADWLFREKRLLVSGQDSGGSDNDWAVYVVSGLTAGSDNDARLLFVEGYNVQNSTNYAYSNPIDFSELNHGGEFVLRVSRSALDGGDATVSFYAQRSLYDDWATNALGSSTITPDTATAGADAQIQVLGEITGSGGGDWADAGPASCAVSRVMVFSSPISFSGDSDTSASAHAYVDGGATSNFGYYTYAPTVDIDLSGVSVYSASFNSVIDGITNLTTTVTEASSNDLDILAMRRIGGTTNFWYYGHAASGGDTLSIDGLTASTSHDVKVTVYTVADGTETEYSHAVSTDGSGVLTIDAQDTYTGSTTYAGSSIKQISVEESATEVAKFLPTTIAVGDTTGADSVDSNNTWTLTRTFPASSVAYAPSQLVNKDSIHVFEGSPKIHRPIKFETHMPFSVAMQIRRFWDSGTYDIFKLHTSDSDGLTIYFEDDYLKASFTQGSVVERVEWQETSYGSWHSVVVRRDPEGNFSLVVDGTEQDTAATGNTSAFANEITLGVIGEGAASEFNPRFGLAEFGMFDRYLSDAEITLLDTQIS